MSNFIPLESVQVATPCRADWDKMTGDETVRFCQSCQKSVYNLSSMSRDQAQAFVNQNQSACIRFHRRADGTLLLGDCPIGKTVRRRPFWGLAAGFAALLASGAVIFGAKTSAGTNSIGESQTLLEKVSDNWREVPVIGALVNRWNPAPVVPLDFFTGIMAPPKGTAPEPDYHLPPPSVIR